MNPKAVGERSEGIILGRLAALGYVVLLPFGNNQRYDLVVDKGDGKFVRGQCKTATLRDGKVQFWACSTNGFTGAKRGYRGEVDVFWVYCPDSGATYEVPVDAVGETQVSMRIDPPKNGMQTGIRWAKDFIL
jgi:hypothetical protein